MFHTAISARLPVSSVPRSCSSPSARAISRSTAAALIACYVKTGDGETSAAALRTAAPHAAPNRRIISLADAILGCAGALNDARERMGAPSLAIVEAPLTTLRFDPS